MCELSTPFSIEADRAEFLEGAHQVHMDIVSAIGLVNAVVARLDDLDNLTGGILDSDERKDAAESLGRLRTGAREVLEAALRLI